MRSHIYHWLMICHKSVLNRSPPEILHEIVLVDDGSTHEWLKDQLQQHVSLLPKTRLVRLPKRSGLVISELVLSRGHAHLRV